MAPLVGLSSVQGGTGEFESCGTAGTIFTSELIEAVAELVVGGREDEEAPAKLYAVVNPELQRLSKDLVMGTEGCLSIPGYVGDVERHESLVVKGQNRRGQPVTIKAKGWLARIFQHEYDHLDGVLFVDKAEKVWRIQPEQEKPGEPQMGD